MRYLRNRPERDEEVRAALVATVAGAAVGLVSFYLARLLIAREPLPAQPTSRPDELEPGET